MNTRLLRRVQRQILKEPRQVVMEDWFVSNDDRDEGTNTDDFAPKHIPNCGTAGCIAGWTVALQARQKPSFVRNTAYVEAGTISHVAADVLDLDERSAARLFMLACWPTQWEERYLKTKPQTKARAKVIVARIEAFIRSKGRV